MTLMDFKCTIRRIKGVLKNDNILTLLTSLMLRSHDVLTWHGRLNGPHKILSYEKKGGTFHFNQRTQCVFVKLQNLKELHAIGKASRT